MCLHADGKREQFEQEVREQVRAAGICALIAPWRCPVLSRCIPWRVVWQHGCAVGNAAASIQEWARVGGNVGKMLMARCLGH